MTDEVVPERRIAFGRRIRAIREQADLSQTAVAAAAGLDRSFYVGVESARNNVSVDNVFLIADALGVDVAELFTNLGTVTDSRTETL